MFQGHIRFDVVVVVFMWCEEIEIENELFVNQTFSPRF
jgi:hypothetical protein